MGALCCVAAGPHEAKSDTGGRDHPMDLSEPHWRTNSSFSPPPSRIWNCRSESDGLPHWSHGVPLCDSSLSSNSEGNRSRVGSHGQSAPVGGLLYPGSTPDNFQAPQWTSLDQKFNFGSRPETSWFPLSTERQCAARASVASHSDGSPSSLSSETGPWESSSKPPPTAPNHNFPNQRSFMSKLVYPFVFHNPVSDCETIGDGDTSSIGRPTPLQDRIIPSHWRYNSSSIEHKFHTTLTEFQKAETSPHPSASSRREGFRWSSASSYDMGFDGENFDIAEHMGVESLRSPHCPAGDKKCGVCGKLLRQKSPWSSNRIMRGGDMPIAGILPCSHVFHAECLEQMTPKTQIHDPPCPACLKTIGLVDQETSMVSESLQMALRSVGGNRGVVIANTQERCSNDEASNQFKDGSSRAGPQLKGSAALIRNHLKKRLTFKGKIGKDFVSTKVFGRRGSSSSSGEPVRRSLSILSIK